MVKRNLYIDCLRGVSIFTVVMTHGIIPPGGFVNFFPKPFSENFARSGYYGVVVFFVISGFLISSHVLSRWKSPDAIVTTSFYVMRAGRILPLLMLFLLVSVIIHVLKVPGFIPDNPTLVYRGVGAALTFQYNNFYLNGGNVPGMYQMSPLWSLSIEEIFYIGFPLVLLVLRKRELIVLALAAMIISGPASRYTVSIYSWRGTVDLLAIGCALGFLVDFIKEWRPPHWVSYGFLFLGIGILGVTFTTKMTFVFAPSAVAFGAAAFLFGAHLMPSPGRWLRLSLSPIALMGTLSYEIYLFHWTVGDLLGHKPLFRVVPYVPTVILVLLGGGWLLNRYFTEPLNKGIRARYDQDEQAQRLKLLSV